MPGFESIERSLMHRLFVPLVCGLLLMFVGFSVLAQAPAAPPKTPPVLGTIQSITADSLTVKSDAGVDVKVQIPAGVKVLQVPPDSKDLKQSTPIQLTDLQPGDRVLVRIKPAEDASSPPPIAAMIVTMKKADLAAKHEKENADWQRHGIGGLVSSADPAQNSVTIKTLTAAGSKEVVIRVSPGTILRRYAPGSVNFDEAKVAPITEIQAGDQLRARGTRSADGGEFAAEEIVSGSFRNIAGIVVGVNPSTSTLTLNDLATKKQVELKVTPESQMRKLPQPMAMGIAARLKGAGAADAGGGAAPAGGAAPGTQGRQPAGGAPSASAAQGQAQGNGTGQGQGAAGANQAGGARRGGGGDMQQLLSHLPVSPLSDFAKGDAVMVVATAGQSDGPPTVITLLGGVEPILQATSQGQAASILSPWSLGQGGGGDAGTP
jgi:hypothetical protein